MTNFRYHNYYHLFFILSISKTFLSSVVKFPILIISIIEITPNIGKCHYSFNNVNIFSHMSQHPTNARYPDAIALAFDEKNNKLTCVYNDHSIYVWDVRDIRRVGKSHSFLYHSACIWGVEMYPVGVNSIGAMPTGSFITCSSDDTIRIWNLEKVLSTNDTLYKRNIYSNVRFKSTRHFKYMLNFS